MIQKLNTACAGCLLFFVTSLTACAQEWTRFRGPNGSGVSSAKIPASWNPDEYNWKVKVPGGGHSSPILWKDRIFVTSGDKKTGNRTVTCLRAGDGKTLWQKRFAGDSYRMHRNNSVSTSTPAVDEDHLYVAWATPEDCIVVALDHAGNEVWKSSLGKFKGNHGFGVSPIVFEDMVILANDQDKGGYLIALDCKTGKQRWKIARQSGNCTYATPCVYQPDDGAAQIIFTNWKHGMTAVDPKAGKVLWELSVFEPNKKERSIASPVIAGNLILGTCGFVTAQKHFVAVKPGVKANGYQPKEVWRIEKTVSYLPTPLVKGDRVYLCTEKGIACCIDATDGKVIWRERLDGKFYSSPVCAGNHLYCTSTDGEVFVLEASDQFQILGRMPLGEPTQSTPAIAGNSIYFRTDGHVFSIGGKK